MNVISYDIELLQPVLVTRLAGDPNSAEAFNYLPGSVLRGAIISLTGAHSLDLTDAAVQRRFFSGQTRFLNAYIQIKDHRALPTPASIVADKLDSEQNNPIDFAAPSKVDSTTQWKGIRAAMSVLNGSDLTWRPIETNVAIHTSRNRNYGRAIGAERAAKIGADEDGGAVYRYESLAKGQHFRAYILCEDSADSSYFMELLENSGPLHLGGSRNAGYGRVRLTNVKHQPNWRETSAAKPTPLDNGRMVVTLLSDAILRAESGAYTADANTIVRHLQTHLPLTLGSLQKAFLGQTLHGGFNRTWGLPLPQTVAVGMGSVLIFENVSCSSAEIEKVEQMGIGERRAEGFGRIAINWHGKESQLSATKVSTAPPPRIKLTPDSPSYALAQQMRRRIAIQRAEVKLQTKANTVSQTVRRAPNLSQLARLRSIIQQALLSKPDDGKKLVATYLKSLNARNTTRKQFGRCYVGSEPLLDWTQSVKDAKTAVIDDKLALPLIGSGRVGEPLPSDLVYEYNLRLIDLVLARVAKRTQQEARR